MDGTEDLLVPVGLPTDRVDPATETSTLDRPRVRKKVTFDLELQVHTIPNRIPLYERRPASNVSKDQHNSWTCAPRPLAMRGKEKQFLSNATSKRIVELFTHGSQSSTAARHYLSGGRFGRQQLNHPPNYFNSAARTLYSLSNLKQPVRMSRAAANFKQITVALGEHLDDSVCKEYGDENNRRNNVWSLPRMSTTAIDRPNNTPRLIRNGGRTILYNSAPILLHRTSAPSWPNKPTSAAKKESFPCAANDRGIATSNEHQQTILKMQTIRLNDQAHITRPPKQVPKPPANVRQHNRKSGKHLYSAGTYRLDMGSITDAGKHVQDIDEDRAASRCSTIDTYVIPADGSKINNNTSNKDKILVSPNEPSVAWEAIDHREHTLRTPVDISEGSGFAASWSVTSRPPNLSPT